MVNRIRNIFAGKTNHDDAYVRELNRMEIEKEQIERQLSNIANRTMLKF